ncbi:hypothetical protein HRbin15_01517 [bacterium HR15]|nr:hypothetical protein HRbin15_01517 [bacterium HR15]
MRVYSRAMGGTSWSSVEDYLPAGNALGYNQNWQYRHTGGELLMMGATGEPSGYYPMDSNGLAVQSELPAPCVCPVVGPQAPMACPPLGYGGCAGDEECFWWGCLYPTVPPGWIENCHNLCAPFRKGILGDLSYYLCMQWCIGSWQPQPPPSLPPDYPRFVPAPPHAPGCIGHGPPGFNGRPHGCVTTIDDCVIVALPYDRSLQRGVCIQCCQKIKWLPALPPWEDRCIENCKRRFP